MAYTVPAAADLIIRYPAFADVDPAVIGYWIEDAQRFVTTDWIEGDYAPAMMALSAHNMALGGLGADSASLSGVPAGIARMKSGALELAFTDDAANARATGSFSSTRYGQEYLVMLRRNRGGPLVQPTGVVPYDPYIRYPQGEA